MVPAMPASALRTSCAMLAAAWPTAASFSAWMSRASISFSAVMSDTMADAPITCPSAS